MNLLKSELDQKALIEYETRGRQEVVIDGQSYRRIQGERVSWNEADLLNFLIKKVGHKKAMKCVKTITRVELQVDEDKLSKLLDKKKVKPKQLQKYQDVQKLSPYIRKFAFKDE